MEPGRTVYNVLNIIHTWSLGQYFLRQQRFTYLSKTNILLNFICPFVPEGENRYSGKRIRLEQNRTIDIRREKPLTNNGRHHPPTQAHSLFRSKGEYMGEILADNLNENIQKVELTYKQSS